MGEKTPRLSEEDEERQFWLACSSLSMRAIWDNEEDDVYEQLLETDRAAISRPKTEDFQIDG
ncbi:MAG: hypothetical protein ACJ8J0_27490 [Longimicrobiaceae bacterium]